jgi:F-type H+-transporting ATPase subunit b
MLQFTKWFFVLLANFLFLLWVLNKILFKPILNTFKERQDNINGSLGKAKELTARKDEALDSYKKEIERARALARDTYEALRNEGLDGQKDILAKSSEEAMELSGKIREEMKAETERARASLKAEVEKFSDAILEKLVRA